MVFVSPRSFAATTSKSPPRCMCARKKFRPIRPNPLMPTRTFAIVSPVFSGFASSLVLAHAGESVVVHSSGPEGKLRGRPSPPVAPRSGPSRQTGSESTGGRARTHLRRNYEASDCVKLCTLQIVFCQVDELGQPAVRCCLRRRRAAFRGELAQRKRGMPEAQLGDLTEAGR